MSNDANVRSPLTFKAGGKGHPSGKDLNEKSNGNVKIPRPQPSPSYSQPPTMTSNAITIIQAGLVNKRSPFQIKNWSACVLTLDGRDKFTKVLQYSSRLLTWYFAGLAKRTPLGSASGAASNHMATSTNLLAALTTNIHLRQKLYAALSQRFHALYKALVTSRKAFRLGRSVIEWDKLNSMGWGDYLSYMMMHPLAGGAADSTTNGDKEEKVRVGRNRGMGTTVAALHTLDKYDTHPIPEEEGNEGDSDDECSWSEENFDEVDDDNEEKKLDHIPSLKKIQVVTRPGRPKLPSRISSNVGLGPSTTSPGSTDNLSSDTSPLKKSPSNPPPAQTVSEMGRRMREPFPSRSSSLGSHKLAKEPPMDNSFIAPPATPAWKLVGGTVKLLGLMGFWACDNLSFLTGSGFLDPIRLHAQPFGTTDDAHNNLNEYRLTRKKSLSEWAGRCYFFGIVAGMYVNARALWGHRDGILRDARDSLDKALRISIIKPASSLSSNSDSDGEGRIKEAQAHLKQTERKHFELVLALLKSCCDFMVFSNNPGIDLHLKIRGRKNHEGLHCLGGLVSASTVLYNNFPNAK